MQDTSEVIIIYAVGQLDALKRYLVDHSLHGESPLVFSLDAEVDHLLQDANIPFTSVREFRTMSTERFGIAEAWALRINQPEFTWFLYRDVSLAKLFVPTIQGYILLALYYVDIFENLINAYPHLKMITVLEPVEKLPASGARIARQQISVVGDCAKLVGAQKKVVVKTQSSLVGEANTPSPARKFFLERLVFGFCIGVLNSAMSTLRGRGKVRILASDYWRNISPILAHIPNAEVILVDRKEILNARFKNIWRYRMKFVHADSFSARDSATDSARILQTQWQSVSEGVFVDCIFRSTSVEPLLTTLFDNVFEKWVPAALQEVDSLYTLFDELQPDVVLLRATVSQQWHFPLMALIAKARGVPSFELLHGMEYPGPGSFDKWHLAQYLGVYGQYIQNQMMHIGLSKEELPIIGSPRFDLYKLNQYAQERKMHDSGAHPLSLFCTAPDYFTGVTFDTYDIEQYFKDVAAAMRSIPQSLIIIKLRPGPRRETFYRRAISEAFAGIPHTVAQYEPLRTLFPQADVAVSCQSTVTLEALQCGVPLILYAATPVEKIILEFNFNEFKERGAVELCSEPINLTHLLKKLADDPAALQQLSRNSAEFLAKEFAFDGKGAERAAKLIQEIINV